MKRLLTTAEIFRWLECAHVCEQACECEWWCGMWHLVVGPRPVTPWTGGIVKQEPWPYGTHRSPSSSGSLISLTNVFLNGAFKADLCMGQTEHVHVSLHWVRVCIPPRVQVSKLYQEASVSFRTSQAYRSTVRLPYVIKAAGGHGDVFSWFGLIGIPQFPCLSVHRWLLFTSTVSAQRSPFRTDRMASFL